MRESFRDRYFSGTVIMIHLVGALQFEGITTMNFLAWVSKRVVSQCSHDFKRVGPKVVKEKGLSEENMSTTAIDGRPVFAFFIYL